MRFEIWGLQYLPVDATCLNKCKFITFFHNLPVFSNKYIISKMLMMKIVIVR